MQIKSGIWDNHKRGAIGGFLRDRIKPRADLSFVSAYFTIYAYEALKSQLYGIDHLRFLFGEPQFIQSLEPNNGADMSKYDKLLKKAVDSIARTFQKRTAAGLQSGRDFVIPDKKHQVSRADDFELVTWLVIQ